MGEVPNHVAIILDGNGRWAKKRNMPRTFGHVKGTENVENICRAADSLGIKYLTFYAFSTENWKRSKDEVDALMNILSDYLVDSLNKAKKNNMRVMIIGDRTGLSTEIQEKINILENASKDYTGLTMIIALNYGGRDEITRAVRSIIKEGIDPNLVTEQTVAAHLDTNGIPDPDLLIRTSGEQRLSNYLLWQLAYTEFYFTDVLWPDFSKKDLEEAIEYYKGRDRRFGNAK